VDLAHLAAGVYAKDLVTTAPLTGAADNVFVGADSDVTIAITRGGTGTEVEYSSNTIKQQTLSFGFTITTATVNYLGAINLIFKSVAEDIVLSSATFTTDSGNVNGIQISFADSNTPFAAGTAILSAAVAAGPTATGSSGFVSTAVAAGNDIKVISTGTTSTPTSLRGRVTYKIKR